MPTRTAAIQSGLPHEAVQSKCPSDEGGDVGVMAKEGSVRAGKGNMLRWEMFVSGAFMQEGGFCPECLPHISIVQGTIIFVILQNLNKIGQSEATL